MTRHVVEGFTLPDRSKYLTAEEMAWLSFLRDLHCGHVRSPSLLAIQALGAAIKDER